MAREYFPIDIILDDILKKMAPWHSKIGAPGFPKKYLWESTTFSPTEVTTTKDVGQGKSVKNITGKSGTLNATIDFNKVNPSKVEVIFKLNGTEQAKVTEEVIASNKESKITFHSSQDSHADLVADFTILTDNTANMKLTFNNKTFEDTFAFGQRIIPQAFLDLSQEIDNYNPKINVDALNKDMVSGLYGEVSNLDGNLLPTITTDWRSLICWLMVLIGDRAGFWGSVIILVANYLFFL